MQTPKRTRISLALVGVGLLFVASALSYGRLPVSPHARRSRQSLFASGFTLPPLVRVWDGTEGVLYSRDANRHTVAAQASDGAWWLATSYGIKRVDKKGETRFYTTTDGLPAPGVVAVAPAPDGAAYCVTRGANHALCVLDPRTDRWRVLKTLPLPPVVASNGEDYWLNKPLPPPEAQIAVTAAQVVFAISGVRGDTNREIGWVFRPSDGSLSPLPWDEGMQADNVTLNTLALRADERGVVMATNRGVLSRGWMGSDWKRQLPSTSLDAAVFDKDALYYVSHNPVERPAPPVTGYYRQHRQDRWQLTRFDLATGKTDVFAPPYPVEKDNDGNDLFIPDTDLTNHSPVALSVGPDGSVWSSHRGTAPLGLWAGSHNERDFYGGWTCFTPATGAWAMFPLRPSRLAHSDMADAIAVQIGGAEKEERKVITLPDGKQQTVWGTVVTEPPTPLSLVPDSAYLPFCLVSARPLRNRQETEIWWIQKRFQGWLIDDRPDLPRLTASRPFLQSFTLDYALTSNPFAPLCPDADDPGKVWTVAPGENTLVRISRAALTGATGKTLPPGGERFALPSGTTTTQQITVGTLAVSGPDNDPHLWISQFGVNEKQSVFAPRGTITWADAPANPTLTSEEKDKSSWFRSSFLGSVPEGRDGSVLATAIYVTRNPPDMAHLIESLPPTKRGGAGQTRLLDIALPFAPEEWREKKSSGSDGSQREMLLVPRLDSTRSIWMMAQHQVPYMLNGKPYSRYGTWQVCRLPAAARKTRQTVEAAAWQTVPDTFPAQWAQPDTRFPGFNESFAPHPLVASESMVWYIGQRTAPPDPSKTNAVRPEMQPVVFGYDMERNVWTDGQPIRTNASPSLVADPAGGDGAVLLLSSKQQGDIPDGGDTLYAWSPTTGKWQTVSDLPAWSASVPHFSRPAGRIAGATRDSIWVIAGDEWLCRWDRRAGKWDASRPASFLTSAIRNGNNTIHRLQMAWTPATLYLGNEKGLWSLALNDPKADWQEITRPRTLPTVALPDDKAHLYNASILSVGNGIVYARASLGSQDEVGLRLDTQTGKWRIYDTTSGFPEKGRSPQYFWDGGEVWLSVREGLYRRDATTDTWRLIFRGEPDYGHELSFAPAAHPEAVTDTARWIATIPARPGSDDAYFLVDMPPHIPSDSGNRIFWDATLVRWNTRTQKATLLPSPFGYGAVQFHSEQWIGEGNSLLADGPHRLLVAARTRLWHVDTETGAWQAANLPPIVPMPYVGEAVLIPATPAKGAAPGDIWVLSGSSAFLWHLPATK